MDQNLENSLKEIRHLLSHLHGEVTALEASYSQVLLVLREFEGAANTDDLTGLLRRRTFFRHWDALIKRCQEAGESCGVLLVDIDHFKLINDTHGHPTGDEVIKRVAQILKRYENPSSFVCRLGGEEFAIGLRGTEAELLGMGEMIRRTTERAHGPVIGKNGKPDEKVSWKCTLSVGVAFASQQKDLECYNASRLLKSADEALYIAKQKGRNQVCAA